MRVDPVDPVAAAARAAARQLAPTYGLPLEAGVEEALVGARTKELPTQYLDPISLGTLIVAIATLAYQIYSDRKKSGGKPTRDNVTQEVQEERRKEGELTSVEEEIIAVVSAQTIIVAADDELSSSDRRRPGWWLDGHGPPVLGTRDGCRKECAHAPDVPSAVLHPPGSAPCRQFENRWSRLA